jgi:hypothetical protein
MKNTMPTVLAVILTSLTPLAGASETSAIPNWLLPPENFRSYIEHFNRNDIERMTNYVDNQSAWSWLKANIPFFESSDKALEEMYYFRWWTFRKHVRQTPDGFVITEFLPDVGWGGKYNTISCAAGHHLYEGRWLRDRQYLKDYAYFWFLGGGCHSRLVLGDTRSAGGIGLATRPDPELPGVGEGSSGFKWTVLAGRWRGRHGGFDWRQWVPGNHQQLHVWRGHGDRGHREVGGQGRGIDGIPTEGGEAAGVG